MQNIFSNGVALDVSPTKFGTLRESNDVLGDPEQLRVRMEEAGYLFFRQLIDRSLVLDARHEILLKYAIIGEIDAKHPIDDAIHAERSVIDKVNLRAFTESVRDGIGYQRVVLNERLINFYEKLLGGPVRPYDFRWPRFVRPGEGCGIHCDGPYMNRGTDKVYSSWIPLGDLAPYEGALIILESSHRQQQLLQSYFDKDADRDSIEWLSTNPMTLQERFGTRWLTTDFKAGDVLCFTMQTVHGALDNRSPIGRCRLSSDTRYQLSSEPLDDRWNGVDPEAHGRDKVFFPGLGQWNNRDFQDEWKRVDEDGRLILTD